jgi:hypothetical protein
MLTDTELYQRGIATLIASWEAYAQCAAGAPVQRCAGVTTAVFPREAERGIYNDAILDRSVDDAQRAQALGAMEAACSAAGLDGFAAWYTKRMPRCVATWSDSTTG